MIPKELIEGVNKMLEAGASKQLVEEFLLERGWSEEDAKAVFREIEKEAEAKKREAAPSPRAPLTKEEGKPREEESESERRVIQAPPRTLSVLKKEEPAKERPKENAPHVKHEESPGASSHAPASVRREKTEKREEVKKEAPQSTPQKPPEQLKKEEPPRSTSRLSQETDSRPSPERASSQGPKGREPRREHREHKQAAAPTISRTLRSEEREAVRKEGPKPVRERRGLPQAARSETESTELFEMETISSPFVLASAALSSVKQRFWSLFFLSFMVSVIYLVLYIFGSYIFTPDNVDALRSLIVNGGSSTPLRTTFLILGLLLGGFVAFGITLWLPASYILAFSTRAQGFRQLFMQGFRGGFTLAVSTLFVFLFVLGGSVLLIIPGVVFAVWFSLAPIVAVIEKTSPYRALLISREIVRRHFWSVLLRELFFVIILALFAIPAILLVSPLTFLDSFGIGLGLVVLLFVVFGFLLLLFAVLFFFFAYHVALYKELRVRAHSVRLSGKLALLLPLFLVPLLIIALSVALYVSSL